MIQPVIEIKNISKRYNITHQQGGYVDLRDVLTNIVKNPFRFTKHKVATAVSKTKREEFWALKGIDITVESGEVIGIIGANGAGKSTLLKILSKITPPTTGEVRIRGKVASLLEVGTGFHQELTGRENIFLNGAILGMTKKEIVKKFDKIVEFSGIQKFIDTPVKRYSSGMHVRLAFSIAAHMEPDILLVDEVLAVGDTRFRKKCLGKMGEVSKEAGRTILFVSHDMTAVRNLCSKVVLLKNGKIQKYGPTNKVISYYLKQGAIDGNFSEYRHKPTRNLEDDSVKLISVRLTDEQGNLCSEFGSTDKVCISIEYEIKDKLPVLFIDFYLLNQEGISVLHTTDNDTGEYPKEMRESGTYISCCKIPKNLLNTGRYFITAGGRIPKIKQFFTVRNILSFQINSTGGPTSIDAPRSGVVCPQLEWTTIQKSPKSK